MTFRMYVAFMALGTLLAWTAWLLVLFNINPDEAGLMGMSIFYVTLFMSLVGTLTLLGVLYRVMVRRRHDLVSREVRVSFRHGIFLSIIAVASLAIAAQGLFKWWSGLGLLAVTCIVEYFFLVKESSRRG
jgi:hypothetical protein